MHKFNTEQELQDFVSNKMSEINRLFEEITKAEQMFYGYSPSEEKAAALRCGSDRLAH